VTPRYINLYLTIGIRARISNSKSHAVPLFGSRGKAANTALGRARNGGVQGAAQDALHELMRQDRTARGATADAVAHLGNRGHTGTQARGIAVT